MANLPEQVHQRGTSVAVRGADDPYALDSTDITLPRLRIAQYQSDSFKRKLADYGDLVVAIGQDDNNPVVVAKAGEPLGEPLRFYIHRIRKGFNYREDPTDNRMTFGPFGGTFQQALEFTGGDPRRVFQKHDYMLTIPAYEDLPVMFLMTSKWGGPAAKWINTQIGIAQQKGQNPLEIAFQVQTRSTHNDKGDFAEAVVGIATVKAAVRSKDAELVASHAALAAQSNVSMDAGEVDATDFAPPVDAPDLG